MKQPNYFFSPTLLDAFNSFLSAESDWQEWYGDADEPSISLAEYEEKAYNELLDKINRKPHEPIEAAERGNAWNDIVDTLLHNTKCGSTKMQRLYYQTDGSLGTNKPDGAQAVGILASTKNFSFMFDLNFCMNAATYFGKRIVCADGTVINDRPSDQCISQVLVEADIETRYGVVNLYGFIDEMRMDVVYDIKTTMRYQFGKYNHYMQRYVYPYCLIESGMATDISHFEFTAYALKGGSARTPLIVGTQYAEVYDYDHEQAKKHIRNACERFIEFIEANRDKITDTNIFTRHSHKH